MNGNKSWKAHPGYSGGSAKVVVVMVLVVAVGAVVAGVLIAGQGGDGRQLTRMLPMVIIPVVLAAVLIPLLAMRRKGGRILLEGDSLVFETGKGRKELGLADLEMSLGKLFTGGHYMGSVCDLRSTRTDETVRLLGGGVEFPPEAYDAADSSTYRFDFSLDAQSFREIVGELGDRSTRPAPAASGRVQAPQPSTRGEQVFQAVPDTSKKVIKIVVLSFAGMMVVGFLGYGLQELLPGGKQAGDNQVLVVILSLLGLAVPAFILFYLLRRGKGGKTYLRFSDRAIVLATERAERYKAEMPPASASVRLWRTSSGHGGSYTQGPAVRLHNRAGKKVTLGVRDPSQAVSNGKTIGMVDYVLSSDAGRAFLDFLRRHGLL